MISVVLLGTGNVAQNLFEAFKESDQVSVIQVLGRNQKHLDFADPYCSTTTDYSEIKKADLYIIAVSDGAIAEVSSHLIHQKGLIVHTSGATPMETLKENGRFGIFYPLQTFTQGKYLSFKDIPICIEATSENDYNLLESVGKVLSNTVKRISSEDRKKIHLAAVFSNNFTNYMYTLAAELCEKHHVDFNLLKPLIQETASKLNELSPKEAQTGPAIRGDQQTLHQHLALLKDKKKREIYTLLSNAIKHTNGKEL